MNNQDGSQRYTRATEIFLAIVDQPPSEREAALEESCQGDPALRSLVEQMMAADSDHAHADGDPVEQAVADGLRDAFDVKEQPIPETIGDYKILDVLGRGGMGIVYRAEQPSPRRIVALKVIRSSLVPTEYLRRLQREAEILARLHHPGIAQIFEASTFPSEIGPQPFFAMEFIDGRPLTEYADDHGLDVSARLALLERIGHAIHHAHEMGVIHRDLKPQNILVTESGELKILDFGVARVTDTELRMSTVGTDAGQVVGTLPYMSPEQIAGTNEGLDRRSDVYALGVVGYELLTGRVPHDLVGKSIAEAARIIQFEASTPLSRLNRRYAGDFTTIIGKCLEKERDRRYANAAAVAQDLGRAMRDEPILAHPPSTIYQMRKFAARNRIAAGSILGLVVVLVLGMISTGAFALAAARQATAAETARERSQRRWRIADRVGRFLSDEVLAQARPDNALNAELSVREALDRAAAKLGAEYTEEPLIEAAIRASIGESYLSLGRYAEARENLDAGRELLELHAKESVDLAQVRFSLAVIDLETGNYDEAKKALESAIPILDTFEEQPLLAIEARAALGGLHYRLKDYEQAKRWSGLAHDMSVGEFGPDHEMTIAACSDLALFHQAAGENDLAAGFYREAMAAQERTLGKDAPLCLLTQMNYGVFLCTIDRMEEGKTILEGLLATSIRVRGLEHPETIRLMSNVGTVFYHLQNLARSRELILQAGQLALETLGPVDPITVLLFVKVANAYYLDGDIDRAEEHFRLAIEGYLHIQGPDSTEALGWQIHLADLLLKAKRYDRVLAISEEVDATLRAQHPISKKLAVNLQRQGSSHGHLGHYDQAEPLLLESYNIFLALRGPDHESTGSAARWVVWLYGKSGDAEARAAFEKKRAGQRP